MEIDVDLPCHVPKESWVPNCASMVHVLDKYIQWKNAGKEGTYQFRKQLGKRWAVDVHDAWVPK